MQITRVVLTRHGGPEVLVPEQGELPAPGPGQVRVAVRAAGINFAEVFCRLGLYKAAPPPPFVPGFEYAGQVVDAGPGADFSPGEAVLGVTRFGGYQSGVVADADRVRRLPAGWSFEEGAALPAAGLTAAYGLIELGRLRPGERVVIHSAAGGVGSVAVQLARAKGAFVIGTVGSDAKLPVLEALGCDQSLNYKRGDWAAEVHAAGGPVDLVFDALGGPYVRAGYRLLRSRGRLVSYGFGTMTPAGSRPNWLKLAWSALQMPLFSPLGLVGENKVVAGFNVLLLWDAMHVLGPLFDEILALARGGQLRPRVGEAAPHTEVGRLHAALQSGATTGKLVITFPPG